MHSVHLLTEFTTVSCVVALPNGETAMITHVGSITLSTTLTLTNVLCVPSFSFNFLLPCFLVQFLFYTGPYLLEGDWCG